jgi:hypothetical protein
MLYFETKENLKKCKKVLYESGLSSEDINYYDMEFLKFKRYLKSINLGVNNPESIQNGLSQLNRIKKKLGEFSNKYVLANPNALSFIKKSSSVNENLNGIGENIEFGNDDDIYGNGNHLVRNSSSKAHLQSGEGNVHGSLINAIKKLETNSNFQNKLLEDLQPGLQKLDDMISQIHGSKKEGSAMNTRSIYSQSENKPLFFKRDSSKDVLRSNTRATKTEFGYMDQTETKFIHQEEEINNYLEDEQMNSRANLNQPNYSLSQSMSQMKGIRINSSQFEISEDSNKQEANFEPKEPVQKKKRAVPLKKIHISSLKIAEKSNENLYTPFSTKINNQVEYMDSPMIKKNTINFGYTPELENSVISDEGEELQYSAEIQDNSLVFTEDSQTEPQYLGVQRENSQSIIDYEIDDEKVPNFRSSSQRSQTDFHEEIYHNKIRNENVFTMPNQFSKRSHVVSNDPSFGNIQVVNHNEIQNPENDYMTFNEIKELINHRQEDQTLFVSNNPALSNLDVSLAGAFTPGKLSDAHPRAQRDRISPLKRLGEEKKIELRNKELELKRLEQEEQNLKLEFDLLQKFKCQYQNNKTKVDSLQTRDDKNSKLNQFNKLINKRDQQKKRDLNKKLKISEFYSADKDDLDHQFLKELISLNQDKVLLKTQQLKIAEHSLSSVFDKNPFTDLLDQIQLSVSRGHTSQTEFVQNLTYYHKIHQYSKELQKLRLENKNLKHLYQEVFKFLNY